MNMMTALIAYRYTTVKKSKWTVSDTCMEFESFVDLSPDNVWNYIYNMLYCYNIEVDEIELISCKFDYE